LAYRDLLPDSLLDNLCVEDSAKRWTERLSGQWDHFLVSEQDGRIVGFAACGAYRDEDIEHQEAGEVYVTYVDPRHWRQGHGNSLLSEALQLLRARGFREVFLWVIKGNQQAISFYEAAGFKADDADKIVTRADGTEMNVLRYRKSV